MKKSNRPGIRKIIFLHKKKSPYLITEFYDKKPNTSILKINCVKILTVDGNPLDKSKVQIILIFFS